MRGFYFVPSDLENGKAHVLQIMKTVEAICDAGVDMMVVTPKLKQIDLAKLFSELGIKRTFPITFLPLLGVRAAGWSRFLVFALVASVHVSLLKLRRQIDFVYVRSEYLFLLVFVVHVLGIPYIYEIHRKGRNRKEQWVKKWLAHHAHGLVVISDSLRVVFEQFNQRIIVVHDAVDLERFSVHEKKEVLRKRFSLPEKRIIATYAGSVTKSKGLEEVRKAAKQLTGVTFCIVGNDDTDLLKDSSENVILVGKVPNKKVPEYLAASDVLLLPHQKSIYAQSPMKLFEYLAVGRPIVAVDLENIREVLRDQEGVLFFKPGSAESLIDALNTFTSRPKQYNDHARQLVSLAKRYSWDARGRDIAKFIGGIQ